MKLINSFDRIELEGISKVHATYKFFRKLSYKLDIFNLFEKKCNTKLSPISHKFDTFFLHYDRFMIKQVFPSLLKW